MNYQSDKAEEKKEEDGTDEEDETDEGDEEDEETIPEWIKMPKDRFDGIKNMVIRNANDGLYTRADNKKITLNNAKKKLQDIAGGRIDSDEAKEIYRNSIAEVEQVVVKSLRAKNMEPRKKMIDIYKQVREILVEPKIYGDADDEDDDEQTDTTDMLDLKSVEFSEQRKNQEGQGLKIVTTNQMLSRIAVNLAQSKPGNNLQKL